MNNTYRIRGWYLLLSIFVAVITLSMIAGPIFFILLSGGVYLYSFLQQDIQITNLYSTVNNFIPFIMLCGTPGLFVGFLTVIGIILPLGNALFSYLHFGPMGLEMRSWPGYRLRCSWDQVIGVERIRIIGEYTLPMLRIRKGQHESKPGLFRQPGPTYVDIYTPNGFNQDLPLSVLLFALVFLWPRKEWNLIPIYLFKGWPNGKLRQDLESKLGHLALD